MPLILVVEQEQRYVERISEALSSHGWEVEGVASRELVQQAIANRSVSVVVVNSEVPESGELILSFSRRFGGPGTVVLTPENGDEGVGKLGADEVLQKPFTDQDIRQAVRRCVVGGVDGASETAVSTAAPPEPTPPESTPPESTQPPVVEVADIEGPRLTSEDIFGDVVSELESALAAGTVGKVTESVPTASKDKVDEERAPIVEPTEPESSEPQTEEPPLEDMVAAEEVEEVGVAVEDEIAGAIEDALTEVGEPVAVGETEVEEEVADQGGSTGDEEAVDDLAALRERAAEEEDEFSTEGSPEVEAEVVAEPEAAPEEEPEEEEAPSEEEEPVEVGSSDEETEAEEIQGEEEGQDAGEVEEPEEEEVEEDVEEKVFVDPADLLDARIRQAADEGTRLARSRPDAEGADDEASPDDLLRAALSGIEREDEFADIHTEVTSAEIDELMNSVVFGKSSSAKKAEAAADVESVESAAEPPLDGAEEEITEASAEGAPAEVPDGFPFEDVAEEAVQQEEPASEGADVDDPALEVFESAGEDQEEYQSRMKLVWAIIIIGLLGLLLFFAVRQFGGTTTTGDDGQQSAVERVERLASAVGTGNSRSVRRQLQETTIVGGVAWDGPSHHS